MLVENKEAAPAVIAAMLQSEGNAIEVINGRLLLADDFSEAMHRMVFCGIERAIMGMEPYDLSLVRESVIQCLRERKAKISTLPSGLLESMAATDTSRWRGYVVTVKRMSMYRKVLSFAQWASEEVEGYADIESLYPEMTLRIEELTQSEQASTVLEGSMTGQLHRSLIKERVSLEEEGLGIAWDWPWFSWNQHVKPLRNGLVGIVAAPDGTGKSAALEQIAEHWATVGETVFVHCENDAQYTLDRRAARLTGVEISSIESGQLTPEQIAELNTLNREWFKNLHYMDGSGCTADEIAAELRVLKARGKCDAVVLDYLNKLRPTRGQSQLFSGRPYEITGSNMEVLKSAAVKGKYPLMTASQMVKDAQSNHSERLGRSKIRGSGEVSEKVQLVLTLERAILDAPLITPTGMVVSLAGDYSPKAKWRIDKQNRGRTGEFYQNFIGRKFSFEDITNVPLK